MRSILFHVPTHLGGPAGLPLFGWGPLLAIWAVVGAVWFARVAARQGVAAAAGALGLPLATVAAIILFVPRLDDGAGVPVRGFGMMLVVAAAAGTWLAIVRGRAAGFDADTILGLATWVFVAGIAGARAFYVIQYWRALVPPGAGPVQALAAVANVAQGGLVVFGALPTAALAAWWYARRHGLPLLQLADCATPGLLLGLALGRVGCFLNGCCFGGRCDLPWAVSFPAGSPPWHDQFSRHLIDAAAARSLPVHPAQLYAALDAALLAALTIAYTPLARRHGEVFALALTLHPVSRLLLESIRIDEPPVAGTPLSIAQWISLVLLALAAALWWWLGRQPPARGAPL